MFIGLIRGDPIALRAQETVMAESYEKRARAKRKQLERRRKLERKRSKEEDEEKVEVSGDEYLMTPEDREAMEEEEGDKEA